MVKKTSKIPGVKKHEEPKHEFSFSNAMQHVQEPLFIFSMLTLLVSAAFYSVVVGVDVSEAGLKAAKSNSMFLVGGIFLLFLLSSYFVYMYFAGGKKNNLFIGVSILIFLTALFGWWTSDLLGANDFFGARDYATWTMFFALLTAAYAIWLHKLASAGTAGIMAILVAATLIHMMPAYSPSFASSWMGVYISDLDSHYYLRQSQAIQETGYVADVERFVYPSVPVTFENGTMKSLMDISGGNFGWAIFMSSAKDALGQFGFSLKDIAILAPGIISAVAILLLYLLLSELFSDMKPYNTAVALLAAFMLMLNPGYASRAIATDSEPGTFGTLLFLGSLWLFTLACRKKSVLFGLLAGFSFLVLNISWSGYGYAAVVLGLFGAFYAVTSFINNKSPLDHIPYYLIMAATSLLSFLIIHPRGAMPHFTIPAYGFIAPLGGVLLLSFILESLRSKASKAEDAKKNLSLGEKIEALLSQFSIPITVVLLLCAATYLFVISSPDSLFHYIGDLAGAAQQRDIIEMTTAEQKATCDAIDATCINTLRSYMGMGVIYGIGMIFVLAYYAIAKRSFGAALILAWSIPMLYGIVYKSQFQLVAAVPIVALGATIGLVLPLMRKEIQTLRILPLLIIILLPMAASLGGATSLQGVLTNTVFGVYGGPQPMYMGAMADRIYWEGTFQWLAKQPATSITLTWWDYGHWIAALPERISILDNTKSERFMVKDVARFHVVEENETRSMEIAKKYNTTYVVIDYSMIGKSGAPHFIGSSAFGERIPLERIGAVVECMNANDCKNAIYGSGYATTQVSKSGSVTVDTTEVFDVGSITIKLPTEGSYRYYVESSADKSEWQKIVDKTSGEYSGLQTDEFITVKARYLRVVGTYASTGDEFKFSIPKVFNPRIEGSYLGYGQCGFDTTNSQIKPSPVQNDKGGFDMVSRLIFNCNTGIALIFDVKDGKYSADNVYIYMRGQLVPWKQWQQQTGASILGVQSMQQILGNAMNYPEKYANFQTFVTFVYVPKDEVFDYNKVMMTKLYLGDYLEEYQAAGLADKSIEKSKYFTLVDGFKGDTMDSSYYGYVKVYKANYPQ